VELEPGCLQSYRCFGSRYIRKRIHHKAGTLATNQRNVKCECVFCFKYIKY